MDNILAIETEEQMREFVSLQSCFNKELLIIIGNMLKKCTGKEITNAKDFLLNELNCGNAEGSEAELDEINYQVNNLSEYQAYHLIYMVSDLLG